MKRFQTIVAIFFIGSLSAPSFATVVDSFSTVTVNPKNNSGYKVIANVHFVTANGLDAVQKLVARESIASAIKALSVSDIKSEFSISFAKEKIYQIAKEAEFIGGDLVERIYITDLVVVSTGERYVMAPPERPKN